MAEKAGLRSPGSPEDYAVGFKEVIELSSHAVEERFGLVGEEGVAHLFSAVCPGADLEGAFLYTNRSSLSLGVVIGSKTWRRKNHCWRLRNSSMSSKSVRKLPPDWRGRNGGVFCPRDSRSRSGRPHPSFTDGFLVAGDAAGFSLNVG